MTSGLADLLAWLVFWLGLLLGSVCLSVFFASSLLALSFAYLLVLLGFWLYLALGFAFLLGLLSSWLCLALLISWLYLLFVSRLCCVLSRGRFKRTALGVPHITYQSMLVL